MARPTKLTPDVKEKLLSAIRAGNYYETACIYAGIEYQTFRNWMIRGEEAQSGDYFEFFDAVKKAEAIAETRIVALWQNAIPNDWRAAKDFLERRYPSRWGRIDRHEITGKDGGDIHVNVNADAKEQLLDKLHSLIAKAGADGVDE